MKLSDESLSTLKETDEGGSRQDRHAPLTAVCVTFAFGVTVALILHIYLGERQVCQAL